MRTIPKKAVAAIWSVLLPSSERLQKSMSLMSSTQPYLFQRLSCVDRGLVPPTHRGLLLIYSLAIWTLMSERNKRKPSETIKSADWESVVERNIRWFCALTEGSSALVIETAKTAIERCNQGPLLSAVVEALILESRTKPGLPDERLEVAIVHLKSLVDCLDYPASRQAISHFAV